MTSMEDMNSTATTSASASAPTSGNFIDTSQDDYFRLYDATLDDDGDGEDDVTNLIVGIWNPQNNQTNTTTSMMLGMNDADDAGISEANEVIITTWTSASLLASASSSSLDTSATSLPSHAANYTSASLITASSLTPTSDYDSTAASSLNSTDTIEGIISLFSDNDNDTLAPNVNTTFAQTSPLSTSSSSSSAFVSASSSVIDTASQVSASAVSSYGNDVDIALIDHYHPYFGTTNY